MTTNDPLRCDGCGQSAAPEHIARRVQRLEWTTRYRPVHIQTLLLGAVSPDADDGFLYTENGEFQGEAALILDAMHWSPAVGKADTLLAEVQRHGLLLTHVLECPMEKGTGNPAALESLLAQRVPAVIARIRRSLKPRRVILISQALEPVMKNFSADHLGCPVLLDSGRPFALDGVNPTQVVARLRDTLSVAAVAC